MLHSEKFWRWGLHRTPYRDTRSWYPQVQFSSVAQSCLTLCNLMDCSMPGLPVHHQLPELTQTHVHRVDDTIRSSHPLSSPSPPASILPSIRVFSSWVSSLHQAAKARLTHSFTHPCSLPSLCCLIPTFFLCFLESSPKEAICLKSLFQGLLWGTQSKEWSHYPISWLCIQALARLEFLSSF